MSPYTLKSCVILSFAAPALLFVVLAVPVFLSSAGYERMVGALTRAALSVCFAALLAAAFLFFGSGHEPVFLRLGDWISGSGGFAFDFLIDGWSLGFALLSVGICGVVSSFSFRYLHQEPGFQRYFLMLVAFVIGLLLVALAGSIEVLYAGWEIIGLSSALLVAFFHERPAPIRNGFRVLSFYRIGDVCMLLAAVLLHHWAGSGSLSLLFSGSDGFLSRLGPDQITLIAVLLIAAAAAKSALLPFSTWLPRAMEGPTPSSAVYYGALSIHAGCFLLLRSSALIQYSISTRALTILVGASTAAYAALLARAQTDVKSRLCFASLTQVGIIVVEIAVGLEGLAFVHMAGNAFFRLLQFLSAPNILHDLHELENDLGNRLSPQAAPKAGWIYLLALERGFLDGLIDRRIVGPLFKAADILDRFDRRMCRGFYWKSHEAPDGR